MRRLLQGFCQPCPVIIRGGLSCACGKARIPGIVKYAAAFSMKFCCWFSV
jgi:hypothetical protein